MGPSKSHGSISDLNEVATPADGCHSGVEVAYKSRPLPVASMHFLSNRSEKPKSSQWLYLKGSASFKERWLGRESNPRHEDFQSSALPTELPSLFQGSQKKYTLPSLLTSGMVEKSPLSIKRRNFQDTRRRFFARLKSLSTVTRVGTSPLQARH